MLDDLTTESTDRAVHSIAHSVIHLDQLAPIYGGERRRLRVVKCRGQSFRGGYHDFNIEPGGVAVFPRLVAADHRSGFFGKILHSGIAGLDQLLGGGAAAGSSTLVIGPAGTGKSLLSLHYLAAAVGRGGRGALFVFDEELGLLFSQAKGLGIDLEAMRDEKKLVIQQMDAAELAPGEFSHRVRSCVNGGDVSVVVIDSLNGYQAAMPEEQYLILHLHELLQYLNRRGAATFLAVAQHGMIGGMKQTIDVTYLADTVIMLRYFEALGRVRRAISAIKKRTGSHEDTIREFRISGRGIEVGPALQEFQGVLRGVPTYVGGSEPLLREKKREAIREPAFRTRLDPRAAWPRRHGGEGNLTRRQAACRHLPRHSGAAWRNQSRRRRCGGDRRIDAQRRHPPARRLCRGAAAVVGLSLHPAHGAWRRTGAQSRSGTSGRGARQRHVPGASVSSDHAGERGANRAARPRTAIRVPPVE
jgi:KaiC/GvpD/RAD55 family RecA-like ATPase